MATLIVPDIEIVEALHAAEFKPFNALRMTQIVLAENLGPNGDLERPVNALVVNVVDTDPERQDYLSLDVGPFGLNTHWWPDPSLVDRFLVGPAAVEAFRIWMERSDNGRDPINGYNGWTTYKLGWHEHYLHRALAACESAGVY